MEKMQDFLWEMPSCPTFRADWKDFQKIVRNSYKKSRISPSPQIDYFTKFQA